MNITAKKILTNFFHKQIVIDNSKYLFIHRHPISSRQLNYIRHQTDSPALKWPRLRFEASNLPEIEALYTLSITEAARSQRVTALNLPKSFLLCRIPAARVVPNVLSPPFLCDQRKFLKRIVCGLSKRYIATGKFCKLNQTICVFFYPKSDGMFKNVYFLMQTLYTYNLLKTGTNS